jgi:uncharacterized membrane protein
MNGVEKTVAAGTALSVIHSGGFLLIPLGIGWVAYKLIQANYDRVFNYFEDKRIEQLTQEATRSVAGP